MTLLQHHIVALSLTAVTTFGLGLLVCLADPKRRLNHVFGLYSLSIAWWAAFEAFVVSAKDQTTANVFVYFEWPGVIFIAPTFLHTVLLLTEEKRPDSVRLLRASYLISFFFTICHLLGKLMRSPRPVGYTNFFSELAIWGWLCFFTFAILVNIGLWRLFQSYRAAVGHQRTQLKYLFWGSLIGYVGGSPDWFLTMGFYLPVLSPFGIYGVPLYSIATTYAVLHHRLFNVHLVIRKSLIYSLLVTILTIGYFGLVYGIERLFQVTFGYQSVWLSLSAFALMALAFQPLKIGIQRVVDRLFFRAPHEEMVRRMERLEREVREADKHKALSTLASGMAHEIKNPLSSIKTFVEYLPAKYDDPSFRDKFVRIVTHEVEKINTLVQRVLDFAKPTPPQRQSVPISKLLDETIELLHERLLQRHIDVTRSYAVNEAVSADPTQLRQVFLNVLLNSAEAMNGSGRINVATSSVDGHLEVAITDTGPGIEPRDLSRVFDPFYTTKSSGTGLGLSVVQSIVKEHGGRITLDSQPGLGTSVRIRLPLADKRPET